MRDFESIEYKALERPISFRESLREVRQSAGEKYTMFVLIAVGVAIVAGMFAVINIFQGNIATQMLAAGCVLALGAALLATVAYNRARQIIRLREFADDNGVEIARDAGGNGGHIGLIFDNGHSRRMNTLCRFKDGTELGQYQYTTGSGKHQQTHTWLFGRILLPRRLPHMVLDNKSNNFFRLTNLPDTFRGSQRLSLEGDFDTHFTLYAPKEYETDALYIFTPDVMATILDAHSGYDVEIIDNSLYVFKQGGKLMTTQTIRDMTRLLSVFGAQVREQGDYYADARVGDRSIDRIHDSGRRLQSNTGLIFFIVAIVVSLAWLALMYL